MLLYNTFLLFAPISKALLMLAWRKIRSIAVFFSFFSVLIVAQYGVLVVAGGHRKEIYKLIVLKLNLSELSSVGFCRSSSYTFNDS